MSSAPTPPTPTSPWEYLNAACGVIYFVAWSYSFYPQLILNHRRRSALGLAPDYVLVNPIGFLCLTVWTFGAYFSTTARKQYAERHEGHLPQVSKSDLAFAAHALLVSTVTLAQSGWMYYRAHQARKSPSPVSSEETALLRKTSDKRAPVAPLKATRIALIAMALATLYVGTSTVLGRTKLLDFLYFASSLKIVITTLKYIPQLFLNHQLRSVRGFAIAAILADLTGGFFSLSQLVISSVFIDHHVPGIWANPGKLGLALITIGFDLAFIFQHFVLYPNSEDADVEYEENDG